MLDALNQTREDFHGYVLAVTIFAEAMNEKGQNGLGMLRKIAGLDPEQEDGE
jgi:hypothetical protein